MSEPAKIDLETLLADHTSHVQLLTRQAVDLVLSVLPNAHRSQDKNDLGFGDGPGYKGLIFAITPLKSWVRLGISGGTTLLDPNKIMTRSGKVHRQVRLETEDDIRNPALRELLVSAVERRKS